MKEKREKKRSTQSSLASSETQSVKIFTSCCLMQIETKKLNSLKTKEVSKGELLKI